MACLIVITPALMSHGSTERILIGWFSAQEILYIWSGFFLINKNKVNHSFEMEDLFLLFLRSLLNPFLLNKSINSFKKCAYHTPKNRFNRYVYFNKTHKLYHISIITFKSFHSSPKENKKILTTNKITIKYYSIYLLTEMLC